MKTVKRAAALLLMNTLLISSGGTSNGGQGKHFGKDHGGQAARQMSSKGSANTNAQWSADPQRGWVRAEERRNAKNRITPSKGNVENKGKQSGDKSKKF
jgi:hypothetical protein